MYAILSLNATKNTVISEAMKRRGSSQRPLVRRLLEVIPLFLLTDPNLCPQLSNSHEIVSYRVPSAQLLVDIIFCSRIRTSHSLSRRPTKEFDAMQNFLDGNGTMEG